MFQLSLFEMENGIGNMIAGVGGEMNPSHFPDIGRIRQRELFHRRLGAVRFGSRTPAGASALSGKERNPPTAGRFCGDGRQDRNRTVPAGNAEKIERIDRNLRPGIVPAEDEKSDPATDLSATSSAWKAIDAATGALVTPNGSGTTSGTVKLDYVASKWQYATAITSQVDESRSCQFKDITCASGVGDNAKLLLQALAFLPDTELAGDGIDANYGGDGFWANNAQAERCLFRGGGWNFGSYAGVFCSSLDGTRSNVSGGIGGRVAFIENP